MKYVKMYIRQKLGQGTALRRGKFMRLFLLNIAPRMWGFSVAVWNVAPPDNICQAQRSTILLLVADEVCCDRKINMKTIHLQEIADVWGQDLLTTLKSRRTSINCTRLCNSTLSAKPTIPHSANWTFHLAARTSLRNEVAFYYDLKDIWVYSRRLHKYAGFNHGSWLLLGNLPSRAVSDLWNTSWYVFSTPVSVSTTGTKLTLSYADRGQSGKSPPTTRLSYQHSRRLLLSRIFHALQTLGIGMTCFDKFKIATTSDFKPCSLPGHLAPDNPTNIVKNEFGLWKNCYNAKQTNLRNKATPFFLWETWNLHPRLTAHLSNYWSVHEGGKLVIVQLKGSQHLPTQFEHYGQRVS